ncbi:MAG TPA: hypothetical protein VF395_10455 [Polyangiaceae bacterium]
MGKLISNVVAAVVLGSVVSLASCAADKAPAAGHSDAVRTGSLKMALQTTSASGKVYRLRNAILPVTDLNGGFVFAPTEGFGGGTSGGFQTFDGGFPAGGFPGFPDGSVGTGGKVFGTGGDSAGGFTGAGGQGSGGTVVLNSEIDPSSPVLETFLNPSTYEIQLLDGWFVEQVDLLLGRSAVVDASLISSSFQVFSIQSKEETFITFDFEVDGQRVTFGDPGRLIVGITVHERNQTQTCGNGVVDIGEACDGKDLGGQTCASATLGQQPFGFLFCGFGCTLDTSGCFGNTPADGGTGGGTSTGGTSGVGGAPSFDGGVGGFGAGAPVDAGSFAKR